jgi:hypothetical protein
LAELLSFFTDDAIYIAGPRGVHRGLDAISLRRSLRWGSEASRPT